MIERGHLYIGGAWVRPRSSTATIPVVNPATEEVIGSVPAGGPDDVDAAVVAARRAQPGWAATAVAQRCALLRAVAAALRKRSDEVVDLVIDEVGTPLTLARVMQCGIVAGTFANAADEMEALEVEEELGNSRVRREPVGVVGCITPWNFPLYQLALKVAPAMAAGCTVVAKPSELAGLSPFLLTDIIHAAGFPPGVFNLVSGDGATVGEAIAAHPGIDMVSFTGSDRAGARVAELAARSVKRVALELGGKSAQVVLDDADLERAVPYGVASAFNNAGQMCAALTRMVVVESVLDRVEELAVAAAATYTMGDPHLETTRLGPLISATQRERVRGLVRAGMEDGAALLTGGPEAPPDQPRGFYALPTVFSRADPTIRIAQQEIFGPVLTIIPVADDDEAVAVANGTPYGLSGAVWSAEVERAERIGARMDASTVYINGGAFNPVAPFGGTKRSGYGRERGRFGIEEFQRLKAFQY